METTNLLPSAKTILAKFKTIDQYLSDKQKLAENYASMKQNEPFSKRFNIFVETWFEDGLAVWPAFNYKDRLKFIDHLIESLS